MLPPMDAVELTRQLVGIPSVTNEEGAVCRFVIDKLEAQGWHVQTQEVPPEGPKPSLPRLNILALAEPGIVPQVVLTTHLDTVPPFIELTEDDEWLKGRGTCDAKGIFAAMWAAAESLRQSGETRVALLGVVGEETDSIGAKMVSELLPKAGWIVDGEPTENKWASGAKGILALTVKGSGKPCHSAYPELGHSAVHDVVSALDSLLKVELPHESYFGPTTVNIGTVQGGLAPNVLAPAAEARVMIRLGGPGDDVLAAVKAALGEGIEVEVTSKHDPHRIHAPDDRPKEVVRFGSDVPYLAKVGRCLLFGPGSIHDAHTAHECIRKEDLMNAVEDYKNVSLELLKLDPKEVA